MLKRRVKKRGKLIKKGKDKKMIIVLILMFALLIILMFCSIKNPEKERIDNAIELIEKYRDNNNKYISRYSYHDVDRIQVNEMLNRISYCLTKYE